MATWWLGEPAALDDAWGRLDKLIIKPLERSAREPALFGADLDEAQRAALRKRVAARAQRYVAQEWVHLSQAPVLERSARPGRPAEQLASRSVGLRVFAVATPNGYHVMPGGLTRVAGDERSRGIAMQRGGRSKDAWVLSPAPVNASFSLLSRTVRPQDLVASAVNVPSRAAENLYWFGRYGERCESAARLLRVAIGVVLDESKAPLHGLSPALVVAQRFGLIGNTDHPGADLLRAATHPEDGLGDRLPAGLGWAPLRPAMYETFAVVHREGELSPASRVVVDLVTARMRGLDRAMRARTG